MGWQKFNCSLTSGIGPEGKPYKYHPSDGDLSICQFNQTSGYLRNAWMTLDDPPEGDLVMIMPSRTYLLVKHSGQVLF
jgi:hypothetical protein